MMGKHRRVANVWYITCPVPIRYKHPCKRCFLIRNFTQQICKCETVMVVPADLGQTKDTLHT